MMKLKSYMQRGSKGTKCRLFDGKQVPMFDSFKEEVAKLCMIKIEHERFFWKL
jgi:hypothetical protein